MLQARGEPDLALEALGTERGGQLGVEHLERHRPVVPEVPGEEDRGHAPAAELALEGVPVPQAFLQRRYRIGHDPLYGSGNLARYRGRRAAGRKDAPSYLDTHRTGPDRLTVAPLPGHPLKDSPP